MTPSQAAIVIGCSPQQVRTLIRTGKIQAERVDTPFGFYYNVTQTEAEQYRDSSPNYGRGWPRGRSYSWE